MVMRILYLPIFTNLMTSFFRKIRMKFLSENRVTRYFFYAIGEIILVVIGILLALQINTWNNERQERALERISLENLREDLIIQKEIIEGQLEVEARYIALADSCMLFLSHELSAGETYDMLSELASRRTFVANRATFDNMGASGEVVLISDPELQNALVRYYQQLDYTKSVVNNNNLFNTDSQFGSYVHGNGIGFRLLENGTMDSDVDLSPEQRFTLKAQLGGRTGSSESITSICNRQMTATDELIGMIDETLNDG